MSLKIHSRTQFIKVIRFLFFLLRFVLLFSAGKQKQRWLLSAFVFILTPGPGDSALLSLWLWFHPELCWEALIRACASCPCREWWMSLSYGCHRTIGTFWKAFPQTLTMLTWTQLKTDLELDRLHPWIVSNYSDIIFWMTTEFPLSSFWCHSEAGTPNR